MTGLLIEAVGDDALSVRTEEDQAIIEARASAIRATGSFTEVVPTVGRLTVMFDPLLVGRAAASAALARGMAGATAATRTQTEERVLPARYDGQDLAYVADLAGLTVPQLIDHHAGARYTVAFLGFTPGFAYLDGLPEALSQIGRLASPRQRVAAGSIGIAGGRSGVYAMAGPGGWPIIATTNARLFDGAAKRPFALSPGLPVRFEPVT